MIIYQIYPRSFLDTNGDGIGDLPGVIEKIPYIADLGADAIWVSPFFTSPMRDFGYDISDYRGVDPIFGTIHDFEQLVNVAHKNNIKVLIDQVWGHCSDQHPWFRESRLNRTNAKEDWFTWADPHEDGYYPNNWIGIFGGPTWTWNAARGQYYLHHFLSTQPALNLWNDEVFEAVVADALFWIDMGVDGFRVDAMPHFLSDRALRDNPPLPKGKERTSFTADTNPRNFQDNIYTECQPELIPLVERFRHTFQNRGRDILLLGEIMTGGLSYAAEFARGTKRMHTAYTGELISNDLTAPVIKSIITAVQKEFDDPAKMTWSLGNHDVMRLYSRLSNKKNPEASWRLLVAWYFSLEGSLCWYNGDELGLAEADIPLDQIQDPFGKAFWPDFKGRDGCRTPMPWKKDDKNAGFSSGDKAWLPVPVYHQELAVDTQLGQKESKLEFLKKCMTLRRHPALAKGTLKLLENIDDDVVGFIREKDGQKLLCLFNFSEERSRTVYHKPFIIRHPTDILVQSGTLVDEDVILQPQGYVIAKV
jgi:alpha-glucosidase